VTRGKEFFLTAKRDSKRVIVRDLSQRGGGKGIRLHWGKEKKAGYKEEGETRLFEWGRSDFEGGRNGGEDF